MEQVKPPRFSRGDVIAHRFEVDKELGSGLLGASYLCKNVGSGKFLVVKVFRPSLVHHPKDRERLRAAFERARKVDHDGLVKLGELIEVDDTVVLTEQYFQAQSLRELIDEYQANQQSFALQDACQIMIKVLDAVQALHDQGLIHRDLKPENVLVATRKTGPGGKNLVRTVKVTDAGLADVIGSTIFAESFVSRSEAKYLAPELAGFEDEAHPQADVYSCGVMLYELLVGQPPRGTYLSPTQLRGDLPEVIDDVVENALGQLPSDRYPAARDMAHNIQRSFEESSDEPKKAPQTKAIIAAIAGVVVAALAVGIYVGTREPPDRTEPARAKDDRIRAEVQAQSRVPSEEELSLLVQSHPEMLYIPPGPFVMGRLHQEELAPKSEPLAKVVEVPGFFIDRFEFPNKLNEASKEKPVTKTTFTDAESACTSIGKRLCTEAEWEKACKGPANWIYAYGDAFDGEQCGGGVEAAYMVGDKVDCVSGYGAQGMSVGPREWTSTSPSAAKTNRRTVKGGMKGNPERGARCAFAQDESVGFGDSTLSFRCCLDLGTGGAPANGAPAAGGAAPSGG